MAITLGEGTSQNRIRSDGNMTMNVSTNTTVETFFSGFAGGNTNQPAFQAAGTGGAWRYFVANTWNEVGVTIAFDWTWYQRGNAGGGMNSNGRYYAPKSGYYYFHSDFYTLCDTNNTANYVHLLFGINGNVSWNNGRTPYTIYGHGNSQGVGSAYPHGPNISAIMFLSEGQYCSPYFYKGNSGNTRVYTDHSFFCGHLIS
jgi:hypothetical protein